MQHVAGTICITSVLDLLLAVASPLMEPSTDVSQILCVGLPALLRCVASPSTGSKVAQELLRLMLDRLATDSSLNLLPAAFKLEGALQRLVMAVCMSLLDPLNPFACKDPYFVWSLALPAAISLGCHINKMEQRFGLFPVSLAIF